MTNEKKCVQIFLGGLLTGGILGGITGILFAPKSGKKMRRVISKKADKIIGDAQKQMEDAAEVTANIISEAIKKAEALINDGIKKVDLLAKASENIYNNGKDIAEEKVSKIRNIF